MSEDSLSEIQAPVPPLIIEEVIHTEQAQVNEDVAGASGINALGNISSRILGLGREIALTYFFGATASVDAFGTATIIPKAIYDLLIGGHINGALVPVLSDIYAKEGRQALWRIVSILMSLAVTLLAILIILIELFSPQLVGLVSGGASPQTQLLSTQLLRLTSPALLFLGLFAIFSGTLYTLQDFKWPAFAGVVFNGTIVVMTLIFTPLFPQLLAFLNSIGIPLNPDTDPIIVVAIGWLLGSAAQMAFQFPGMRGSNVRWTFNWRHPALKTIAALYTPVMFTMILDSLIIRPVSYNLASQVGEGSIGYMNWATTLLQFPQGLVATAVSIAILPTLSIQAAYFIKDGNHRPFKDTLGFGLRLVMVLIIPAGIGLFVLAEPIITLLFEHGAFTQASTLITRDALRLYLIGLPFAAIDLMLVYAFYAQKDTKTPAIIGVISLVIYLIVATQLLDTYGLYSLMIADSVKHISHALLSAFVLHKRIGGYGQQNFLRTFAKTTLSALIMGLTVYVLSPPIITLIGGGNIFREGLIVLITGTICVLIYFGLAYLFKLEEIRWLMTLVKARLT